MDNMVFPEKEQMTDTHTQTEHTYTQTLTQWFWVCVTLATNTSAHPCPMYPRRIVYKAIYCVLFSLPFRRSAVRRAPRTLFFFFLSSNRSPCPHISVVVVFLLSYWSSTLRLVCSTRTRSENGETEKIKCIFIVLCNGHGHRSMG